MGGFGFGAAELKFGFDEAIGWEDGSREYEGE